ncbi:MAG: electron transfer flavoprotein subunit alpha/FixB family protein [Candidatus Hodarchaeales archaeon]|jgi:electron transfer flavoprotein alpha subunit
MSVLIVTEIRAGEFSEGTKEVFAVASNLAETLGVPLNAAVVGSSLDEIAPIACHYGAETAYVVDDPHLEKAEVLAWTTALTAVIRDVRPQVVLVSASISMAEVLPRVAVRTDACLVPNASGIEVKNGSVSITRSLFEELVYDEVSSARDACIVTLTRGIIKPAESDPEKPVKIEAISVSEPLEDTREEFLDEEFAEASIDISKAKIIVAGGRGAESKEGFEIIWKIRDRLGGSPVAEVGATRLAVDLDFVPYDHEIGYTGKIVSPDLFISAGISGAIQHVMGMKNSKVIIAINEDEEAPVWSIAHYGLLGDMHEILPAIYERLPDRSGG